MAILKRVYGYEICLWEIEGNALRGIPILLIRKNSFTEIVSFENGVVKHEMGDKINRESVRDAVYEWIAVHEKELLQEYNKASCYSTDYMPDEVG